MVLMMDSGIDPDASLDYATIQIFPTKNRYEIFVCGDDEVEKLAVGQLEQLLPHLPEVNKLYAKGTNAIFKLQVTGELGNAPWFTKSTLNRFLKIASSVDLVNTSKTIEGEISQLEEVRKFHLSLSAQGHQDHSKRGETDGHDSIETESTVKAEAKVALSDSSRNELLRAMDLRLTALKTELATALNHAFGAACSSKEITYLVEFCDYFGATDLKNSFCKILELSQKGEADALLNDHKLSSTIDNASKMDEDTPISRPVYSLPPVKYGVSPAKAAQVERQRSTDSEESSDSSDENKKSAERSRALSRSAVPRRSASPMRRVQIGRTGSRRAAALTIKSLNFNPTRERMSSHRDVAEISSEEEGSEQTSKKPESNIRRMSVQDAINLFERKQKDQSIDDLKKSLSSNISLSTSKSVLRRWSSGVAESSSLCQQELSSEDSVPLPCNDIADTEISNNLVEEKLESDFTSGVQNPSEIAEVDVELERWEEKKQLAVDVETDANAAQGKERNGRTADSVEWSRQKEAELNEMLMKMMESQPVKTQKPKTVKKQNIPSEQRGGFYDHYKEKRDRKLRGENAEKRAEKEAQFRAMQHILDVRKAEIATTNVKDAGKKHPPSKPQKSLKNPSQSADLRKDSLKSSVTKKVPSKTTTLPATRKSWPSTPPTRGPVSSPSKTPPGISSVGTTPRSRKSGSTISLPQSNAKVERSQPQHRNVKETRADANKSLKGAKEKTQRTVTKSGKTTKTKSAAVTEDSSAMVPSKPSFYNKVTKKSTVVPVESKPFLRKGSRSGPPIVNKTKDSSQQEESSVNCGSVSESQENEVVVNASVQVSEHRDQDNVVVSHFGASMDSEIVGNIDQNSGEVENFKELATDVDDGFKDMVQSSANFQSQEDSVISPSAWVEIQEQEDLPSLHGDDTTQLSPPVHVAPVGFPSQGVRHSLSQMLQEDNNSEPDIVEWGNAENPPSVVYQKDAPKGLKRLLKFARKSKGDANMTGWSSPSVYSEGEDDGEESKAINKRNTDNLLRKAAHHSKDSGQQQTSFFEGYDRNVNARELLLAQSNTSSHQLHKGHVSTSTSTTKATRSFFSLSAFRGSKPNETKFH
ncbi:hypothetical protein DKX38_029485 [Salix brachista]|uniref:Uncharacterized protein n=1 Tax=Salix brachista TaxID=2182728 RepID=A0A5N5JBK1_9ROSI|nr:hypothetical protein DKX38_029485 [Salix brachista]